MPSIHIALLLLAAYRSANSASIDTLEAAAATLKPGIASDEYLTTLSTLYDAITTLNQWRDELDGNGFAFLKGKLADVSSKGADVSDVKKYCLMPVGPSVSNVNRVP